jgi:SAM-dependent methyltransferase
LEQISPFDLPSAQDFNKVRQDFIGKFLKSVRQQVPLKTALDVGCGVGYFSKFLSDLGLDVQGIDGRNENVQEAARRSPDIRFLVADAENLPEQELDVCDFVLCVGLLYHLENPFRTVRSLHRLTSKALLIESMCASGSRPSMELVDESHDQNQALNYVAFYPTEACLIKMLYRSGFPYVYMFEELPSHPLFHASFWRRKERTVLAASKAPLSAPGLQLAPDVGDSWGSLTTFRERLKMRIENLAGSVPNPWRRPSLRPQDEKKH